MLISIDGCLCVPNVPGNDMSFTIESIVDYSMIKVALRYYHHFCHILLLLSHKFIKWKSPILT